MEQVEEAERVVIAKPVASRPACSTFRPSNQAVPAIRPRTLRFKPAAARVVSSSQADLPEAAVCPAPFDHVPVKADRKLPNVLYKPTAKLASRTTVAVLKNMQGGHLCNKQELEAEVANQTDFQPELVADKDQRSDQHWLKMASDIPEEDHRCVLLSHTTSGDRPCYDGYHWRKYGQKQVKVSEYPRSYYKCTHPNCPVKKKIERSLNGQIAEVVYKGEHNHSKPPHLKRSSSDNKGEGHEGQSSYSGRVEPFHNEDAVRISNSSCDSGEFDAKSDELMSKRRKNDDKFKEAAGTSGDQGTKVVQNQSGVDSTMMRDGFRWRKYGQKVVKGNPYPRSYYRCTNLKCNVRKYVERTSDEPNAFITTYEGKHNHDMPISNTKSAAKTTTKPLGLAR